MKIMELVFALSAGGAERMVVDLCNRFSEEGHDVILEVVEDLNKPGNSHYVSEVAKNVLIDSICASSGYSIGAILGTLKAIRKHKPDVVHLHSGILVLLLPTIFCKNVRYVHTIHSLAHRYAPSTIKKVIDRFYSIDPVLREKQNKAVLISVQHSPVEAVKEVLNNNYQAILNWLNIENAGIINAIGIESVEQLKQTPYPKQAYELGKRL